MGVLEKPGKLNEVKHLIRVPLIRQQNNYSCGIACLQSILYYYGTEIDYKELSKRAKTTEVDGTDHRNIINVVKDIGLEVELQKGMLLSDLLSFVDKNTPVIAAIQAWPNKPVSLSESWENGHWVIVIGYDEDNVYMMDPAMLGNYTYIPIEEFNSRWHDKDQDIVLRQAGIVIKGKRIHDADEIKKTR